MRPKTAPTRIDCLVNISRLPGLRLSLLAAAIAVPSGSLLAQEDTPDRVVVTGTRISQPDYILANPVVSVSADKLQSSGEINISSYLTELPALTGSLDSLDTAGDDAFVGGSGLNLLSLRNLGWDRTLTLIDGRRHVGSVGEFTAVDTGTIPLDLIERIEIQTGGTSAVYGSDAVTGVVNFILKDDFEGFRIRAQGNSPDDGGAGTQLLALTYGQNFGRQDRGNFAFALEYSAEDRLYGGERDFNGPLPGRRSEFVRNPADTADPPQGDGAADDPAVLDNIPLELLGFGDTSRCGAVFVDGANWPSPDYNCDGTAWDIGTLPQQQIGGAPDFPISPYYQQGGFGTPFDQFDEVATILPEIERTNLNFFLNLDVGDSLEFFTEFKFATTDVLNQRSPTYDFFLYIEPDNPYVPPPLQQASQDLGGVELYLSRDNFDLGVRADDIERETQRAVFGLGGSAGDWADFEVSLVYGTTDVTTRQLNNRFNDRFFAALDVVDNAGVPDCRVNVDPLQTPFDFPDPVSYDPASGDCAPLNLFGDGSPSAEAVAWIMGTSVATDEIEQTVLSGQLTGELAALALPGGAISWAAGAEYREESSRYTPDPYDALGATFGNQLSPNYGEFDVSEVFGELSIPVLAGATAAEELSFDVAYRYADYSTVGTTGAWKLGSIWSPTQDFLIRGTVSQAVRVPNIAEAYAAEGETFEELPDPCDVNNLSLGTQYRAANCATVLTDLGIDPGTFVDPNTSRVGGLVGGNPNVREETADTETIGVVFFPRFAPNLTVAIDYYNIELDDAIFTPAAEQFAASCVDAPTLDNAFCPRIVRDSSTGGISSYSIGPINVAKLATAGFDLTLDYALNPGGSGRFGSFDFRLIANRLNKLDFQAAPGAVIDDDVGEGPAVSFTGQPAPEWQASFDLGWSRGPVAVSYGLQWFDRTQRISNRSLNGDSDLPGGDRDALDPAYYYYDAKLVHDIHVSYDANDAITVFGGVRNLTDEGPAFDRVFYPVSPVGRAYYLGVQASLF